MPQNIDPSLVDKTIEKYKEMEARKVNTEDELEEEEEKKSEKSSSKLSKKGKKKRSDKKIKNEIPLNVD